MSGYSLVFDFGAVLFRWRPAALLQQVVPQRAPDAPAAAQQVAAFFQAYSGDWGEFDRGAVEPPELVRRISQRLGWAPAEVQAVVDAVPAELAPIPESVALLRQVQAASRAAGRPVFYLSNMPAPYARHLHEAHDFVRGFDGGVFSSDVKLIKPDPAIFALAQQRFGVPAAQLVFLDDHPANVRAAQEAGWQALLFTDAAQAERDLRAQGFWPGA